MYGEILRLDASRQNRINPNGFLQLFSQKAQANIKQQDTRLNSSFNSGQYLPKMVRQSQYPDFFRGTSMKTLYWKLKNFPDLRGMSRVFINKDNSVVFEFEESVNDDTVAALKRILKGFGHCEFTNAQKSGKRVAFDVVEDAYPLED